MKTLGWCSAVAFSLGMMSSVFPPLVVGQGGPSFDGDGNKSGESKDNLPKIEFKPSGPPPAAASVTGHAELGEGARAALPSEAPDLKKKYPAGQGLPSYFEPPVKCGEVDMTPVFQRLSDIGLYTGFMREIAMKITVVFKELKTGKAKYSPVLPYRVIILDPALKQVDTDAIRYDLAPEEIGDVVHEFTHAANDLGIAGAPEEALEAIRSSLHKRGDWTLTKRSADEISAYLMGNEIASVFNAAGYLVDYNRNQVKAGSNARSLDEAMEMGGTILFPQEGTFTNNGERMRLTTPFGTNSLQDSRVDPPVGDPVLINWNESGEVKQNIYKETLGLKPPKDSLELAKHLNAVDNEWIKGIRNEVAKARWENAKKVPGQADLLDPFYRAK